MSDVEIELRVKWAEGDLVLAVQSSTEEGRPGKDVAASIRKVAEAAVSMVCPGRTGGVVRSGPVGVAEQVRRDRVSVECTIEGEWMKLALPLSTDWLDEVELDGQLRNHLDQIRREIIAAVRRRRVTK